MGARLDTLTLAVPGDLFSACPHRQFPTIPSLSHSWIALPNFYPNACIPSREAVCTISMMVLSMTRPECKPATYGM